MVDAILYPKLPDPESAASLITDPNLKKSTYQQVEPKEKPAFYPDSFSEVEEASFDDLTTSDFLESLDQYTLQEETFQEVKPITETTKSQKRKSKSSGRLGLSRNQWVIIGLLVIVEIMVILYFAFIVLQDIGML